MLKFQASFLKETTLCRKTGHENYCLSCWLSRIGAKKDCSGLLYFSLDKLRAAEEFGVVWEELNIFVVGCTLRYIMVVDSK